MRARSGRFRRCRHDRPGDPVPGITSQAAAAPTPELHTWDRAGLRLSIDGQWLPMLRALLFSAVRAADVSSAWQGRRVKLRWERCTMKAFDSVFLEVATRERRAIQIVDRRERPTGTWLFREFYCNQPRCDCRRV